MIRDKRNDPVLFDYYMKNGAKYVAGAGPWNRLVATGEEMPMEVVTPSDEALTLLLYENYHRQWMDRHEGRETVRSARYTRQGGVRYGEWNDVGIERFNELLNEVKANRASENGMNAEEAFQRESRAAGLGRRKRRRVTPESRVRVVNDLEDDDSDSGSENE